MAGQGVFGMRVVSDDAQDSATTRYRKFYTDALKSSTRPEIRRRTNRIPEIDDEVGSEDITFHAVSVACCAQSEEILMETSLEGTEVDTASKFSPAPAEGSSMVSAWPWKSRLRKLGGRVRLLGRPTPTTSPDNPNPDGLMSSTWPEIRRTNRILEIDVEVGSEDITLDVVSDHRCAPSEVTPTFGVVEKLFEAAKKGDWGAVENILNEDPDAMKAEIVTIETQSLTVLDFAVITAEEQVVKSLIKRLPSECKKIILKNAIFIAVKIGRTRMVEALLDNVESESEIVPIALSYAIICTPMAKEVISFLARRTPSALDIASMSHLILAGHLDIGYFLASKYPGSTYDGTNKRSLLEDLVTRESCFPCGATLNLLENFIYKCISLYLGDISYDNSEDIKMVPVSFFRKIGELKFRHDRWLKLAKLALDEMQIHMNLSEIYKYLLTCGMVLDSVSCGTSELIWLCLDELPDLKSIGNFQKEVMKVVVKERDIKFFRELDAYNKNLKWSEDIFTDGGLMEALVEWPPERVPANVPGAAFLMQRELHWFKVLEERIDPSFKRKKFKVRKSSKNLKFEETKDPEGKTYREVFAAEREDLRQDAGKWMKETSSSCSVVAALIITVTFAAAFTVPGGYDPDTGIPILLKKGSFMVFAVADALALSFSVAATLMFLAIVTPYYTIEDFRQSLPKKMIWGITFIFLSLACMLVAFGAALTIMLNEGWKWIIFLTILLAAVPVFFFFHIHCPMYVEMVQATYWPRL